MNTQTTQQDGYTVYVLHYGAWEEEFVSSRHDDALYGAQERRDRDGVSTLVMQGSRVVAANAAIAEFAANSEFGELAEFAEFAANFAGAA